MRVRTTQRVNLRHGSPDPHAELKGEIFPGFEFEAEPVDGIEHKGVSRWYRDGNGDFLWGGGVAVVGGSPVPDRDPERAFPAGVSVRFPPLAVDYQQLLRPAATLDVTGAGVKVAVLDSGLATEHPAFSHVDPRNVDQVTGENESGDGHPESHGTHCAGLIGARFCEGGGVRGVAPKATLLSCRTRHKNSGHGVNSARQGIEWALRREADVICAPFALGSADEALRNLLKAAADEGVVVVAAARNNGSLLKDLHFPAGSEHVIAIGAIDSEFLAANPRPTFAQHLDFLLPLHKVWSTTRPSDGGYGELSGSSMASALLSGLIALHIEKAQLTTRNRARCEEVLRLLKSQATSLSSTVVRATELNLMLPTP